LRRAVTPRENGQSVLRSQIAESVPGFSHELLPGVAGILSIPALWGLAGRFARRLAPDGRPVPEAWRVGLGGESRRWSAAVLGSQYEVASRLRPAGTAPVIPGAGAGRAG
jgi:hypothetical protein